MIGNEQAASPERRGIDAGAFYRGPACPLFDIAAALVAILQLAATSAGANPESRVRATHPRLAGLLTAAEHRSATFRNLVDRLNASDVIAHLEHAPPGHPIDGGLQFVASTGSTRYLRVTVRIDVPPEQLMALIGHELRHAVEVAESPRIRDETSFRHYYKRGAGRLIAAAS